MNSISVLLGSEKNSFLQRLSTSSLRELVLVDSFIASIIAEHVSFIIIFYLFTFISFSLTMLIFPTKLIYIFTQSKKSGNISPPKALLSILPLNHFYHQHLPLELKFIMNLINLLI